MLILKKRPYPEKPSALLRARDLIIARLQDGTWRSGDRLPSLDLLAQAADVARFTMWKATKLLAAEGVISSRPGSGIHVGLHHGEGVSTSEKPWQRIVDAITHSIYNGEFLPGKNLPSQQELQVKYRVSYPSIHKALAALAKKRVLISTGTKYAVPYLTMRDSTLEVVMFSEGAVETNEGLLRLAGLRSSGFLAANRLSARWWIFGGWARANARQTSAPFCLCLRRSASRSSSSMRWDNSKLPNRFR